MIFWKRIQAAINDLWYPRSVTVGNPVETQEFAKCLARESTVSPADVHAVIRAMPEVMADFMKESRAVHDMNQVVNYRREELHCIFSLCT